MGKKLTKQFYLKPTLKVAKQLLGKFLIHRLGHRILAGKIVETEAYVGPRDLASHASAGLTKRTETMFLTGGRAYVYLIYGMYHCFNVVTERAGYPAAVLIRALEPQCEKRQELKTSAHRLMSGPGKLCRAMKIDKSLNGEDLTAGHLWIEDRGIKVRASDTVSRKRIGVDYAGSYCHKPWRFYLKDNPYVSQK